MVTFLIDFSVILFLVRDGVSFEKKSDRETFT